MSLLFVILRELVNSESMDRGNTEDFGTIQGEPQNLSTPNNF